MIIPGRDFTSVFWIRSKSGLGTSPDGGGLPNVQVLLNGVATAIVPNVFAGTSAGEYYATFNAPTGWVQGDSIFYKISATVDTLALEESCRIGVVVNLDLLDKIFKNTINYGFI